jgi:nucleoside-diphosphate kinase
MGEVLTSTTLAIIKPDAIERKLVGAIFTEIEQAGFSLRSVRSGWPAKEWWQRFYQEHVGRAYYETLIHFMVSGPVLVVILQLETRNEEWKPGEPSPAVRLWRGLMGASRLSNRIPGTIRHRFAMGQPEFRNLVHGSDSDQAVEREIILTGTVGLS